jgi:hypothetical protein
MIDDGDGDSRHFLAGHLGADELFHAAERVRGSGRGQEHEQERRPPLDVLRGTQARLSFSRPLE